MYKNFFFIFVASYLFSYADNILEVENRRNEQLKFDSSINSSFQNTQLKVSNIDKELILDIQNIEISGNSILQTFQINPLLNKYIGKNKNLNSLVNEIQNKYVDKGYITTRVKIDLEKSNFDMGNISLFIIEGKIDKVYFNEKENKLKSYITFPQRENKILNIKDLDQGIDNLADKSTIDIRPANENGYSDIFIKKEKQKLLSGAINYNDLGQKSTGKHRYKVLLNSHNLIGLNENVSFSFQEKLQREKRDRDTENYALAISIPYKYYSVSYSYEHSEYFRTIPALGRKYFAKGNTTNQNFGIRRILHRNENHKIDVGANITLKDSKNYIDNIRLTTSTRKLSVLTLDTSYIGRIGSGLLSGNISTSFGIKKFGANIDTNEWYREDTSPKAQFRKYNFNLSWYKPINKFYYKLNIGGQYSKDILYSQEKLALGDDTTVRGFKDESIQGDSAFYIRNEIGYRGLRFLEPYIAHDYGRTFNNKVNYDNAESIQGISLGLKIYFKNLEANIALSKPIDKPEYFKENKAVVYTTISYKF